MASVWKMLFSIVLLLTCVACSKSHQLALSSQEELMVVSAGRVNTYPPESAEAIKLHQWLAEHRSGWEPYMATAAVGDLQIKNTEFTLNIRGEVAVLNYQHNAGQEQLRKTINPADFAFLRP
jgi:hypothetical protein